MRRYVPAALVAVAALFSAAVFAHLPGRFAVHWGPGGTPDGYADRWWGAFVIPVLMRLVPWRRPRAAGEGENEVQDAAYALVIDGVLGFLLLAHVCVLGLALGWPIEVLPTVIAGAGMLMVACGVAMRRIGPNRVLGIRTRAALSSPRAWDETHRVASLLFIAGGCVTVAAAAFVPRAALWAALAASLAASLGSAVWSSVVARREG